MAGNSGLNSVGVAYSGFVAVVSGVAGGGFL